MKTEPRKESTLDLLKLVFDVDSFRPFRMLSLPPISDDDTDRLPPQRNAFIDEFNALFPYRNQVLYDSERSTSCVCASPSQEFSRNIVRAVKYVARACPRSQHLILCGVDSNTVPDTFTSGALTLPLVIRRGGGLQLSQRIFVVLPVAFAMYASSAYATNSNT